MKIQNTALAGATLGLRYGRDSDGRPVAVKGDENGVFEMPEKDAEFLLQTEGWRIPRLAKSLPEAPAPAPEPEPVPAALQDPPAADADDEDLDDEEEIPDVDGLRTKAAAMEMAEQYGVELDSDMRLSDMKAKLEDELFVKED